MLGGQLDVACFQLQFVKLQNFKWITAPFTVSEIFLYKKEEDSFQVNFIRTTGFKNIN